MLLKQKIQSAEEHSETSVRQLTEETLSFLPISSSILPLVFQLCPDSVMLCGVELPALTRGLSCDEDTEVMSLVFLLGIRQF